MPSPSAPLSASSTAPSARPTNSAAAGPIEMPRPIIAVGSIVAVEWIPGTTTGGRAKKTENGAPPAPVLLYDVSKDPNETTDLAAQQPERVAKMTAALVAWRASVEKSLAGADYGAPANGPAPEPKKAKKKQAGQ